MHFDYGILPFYNTCMPILGASNTTFLTQIELEPLLMVLEAENFIFPAPLSKPSSASWTSFGFCNYSRLNLPL